VLSLPLHDVPAVNFLVALDLRCSGRRFSSACWRWWARGSSLAVPCARSPTCGQRTMDLARGKLSRRVRTDGPEEVAALATSFNDMAAELERQQALRQSLVHDVAHELRTPLTALQCRLEAVIDGLAQTPWDR
jgi:signal transduction histidine kinase